MNVSENKVLMKIFVPKSEEEKESWRKLHNKELHHFQYSINVVRAVK
jgi:hypothetical protein